MSPSLFEHLKLSSYSPFRAILRTVIDISIIGSEHKNNINIIDLKIYYLCTIQDYTHSCK